jgi:hypothetical protein
MAQFVWCCVRIIFGLNDSPASWSDLQGCWVLDNLQMPHRLCLFLFAGLTWALWRARNKMAIKRKFPSNPLDVIRSGVLFVQKWSLLLKDADQEVIVKVIDKIQVWLGGFRLRDIVVSHIVEL